MIQSIPFCGFAFRRRGLLFSKTVTATGFSIGNIGISYNSADVPTGVSISYNAAAGTITVTGVRPTGAGEVTTGSFNIEVTREGVTENLPVTVNLTSTYVNSTPVSLGGVVVASGTTVFGQTLTADTTGLTTTPAGSPLGALSFQWHRNGTDIAGATGDTLLLTQADIGYVISVTVTAAGADVGANTVTSVDTDVVRRAAQNAPPLVYTVDPVNEVATIDPVAGAEYRFESTLDPTQEWSNINTFAFTSGASLTMQIRFPQTATHYASPVASAVYDTGSTTPPLPPPNQPGTGGGGGGGQQGTGQPPVVSQPPTGSTTPPATPSDTPPVTDDGLWVVVTIPPALEESLEAQYGAPVEWSGVAVSTEDGIVVDIAIYAGGEVLPTIPGRVLVEVFGITNTVGTAGFMARGNNIHRVAAVSADDVLYGGHFDAIEGVFAFKADIESSYVVSYIPSLRRLHVAMDSHTIICLAENAPVQIMDVLPVVESGRTLLPARFIAQALGGRADWNSATREITITIGGTSVTMLEGELLPGMDAPVRVINGRTMVPARFIAETFGALVRWDGDTRSFEVLKR